MASDEDALSRGSWCCVIAARGPEELAVEEEEACDSLGENRAEKCLALARTEHGSVVPNGDERNHVVLGRHCPGAWRCLSEDVVAGAVEIDREFYGEAVAALLDAVSSRRSLSRSSPNDF